MPSRERPVKLDMNFREAIQFLSTPEPERSRSRDSETAESGSTTEAAPEPAATEPQNEYYPTLFDYHSDSQTREDTSQSSGC